MTTRHRARRLRDVLPSDVQIADKMPGASGAEMKACCTEAGMFALRERRVHVTQEDFEMATAKVRVIAEFDADPEPLLTYPAREQARKYLPGSS